MKQGAGTVVRVLKDRGGLVEKEGEDEEQNESGESDGSTDTPLGSPAPDPQEVRGVKKGLVANETFQRRAGEGRKEWLGKLRDQTDCVAATGVPDQEESLAEEVVVEKPPDRSRLRDRFAIPEWAAEVLPLLAHEGLDLANLVYDGLDVKPGDLPLTRKACFTAEEAVSMGT